MAFFAVSAACMQLAFGKTCQPLAQSTFAQYCKLVTITAVTTRAVSNILFVFYSDQLCYGDSASNTVLENCSIFSLIQMHELQSAIALQVVKHCSNKILQFLTGPPLPSNRHHQSNDDCLEGKRENYRVCYV